MEEKLAYVNLKVTRGVAWKKIGQSVTSVVDRGAVWKENRSMLIHIGLLGALLREKYWSY